MWCEDKLWLLAWLGGVESVVHGSANSTVVYHWHRNFVVVPMFNTVISCCRFVLWPSAAYVCDEVHTCWACPAANHRSAGVYWPSLPAFTFPSIGNALITLPFANLCSTQRCQCHQEELWCQNWSMWHSNAYFSPGWLLIFHHCTSYSSFQWAFFYSCRFHFLLRVHLSSLLSKKTPLKWSVVKQ